MPTRRDFLIGAASLATAALSERRLSAPKAGPARRGTAATSFICCRPHRHERFLIKTSFRGPHRAPPVLLIGSRKIPGRAGDTLGFFWTFDVAGLEPGRPYTLQILEARGRPLCDPWQLSTFPSPGDSPKSVRLLIYSCAGGHDVLPDHKPTDVSTHRFLTLAVRRRMLERAMSFAPDAVVANGDHIYWDLRTVRADLLGASPAAKAYAGVFDRTQRVLGTANEQVLKKAVGPQIADLYGTMMRSTPVFFLQDDHDYFENDEADDTLVTFPPDPFMLDLARASQLLYYPEFLPDAHRVAVFRRIGGRSARRRFRELRHVEVRQAARAADVRLPAVHDADGPGATFVPSARRAVAHGAHGGLGCDARRQHAVDTARLERRQVGRVVCRHGRRQSGIDDEDPQGVLAIRLAASARSPAAGLVGDARPHSAFHQRRSSRARRSANPQDLRHRPALEPVITVLPGPVGTGRPGWPSLVRGLRALPPEGLEVEEGLPTLEENGFTIADFTPERVTLRYFSWKLGRPEAALDTLEPFRVTNLVARG